MYTSQIEQQTKEEIWNLELKQAREIGGEEGLDRVDKIRMDKAKDIKTQRNIAVKENKLMFVALHEMGHICTKSIGHTDEFWTNFKWLLQKSIEIKIYKKQDFRKDPKEYCGTTITDSPLR